MASSRRLKMELPIKWNLQRSNSFLGLISPLFQLELLPVETMNFFIFLLPAFVLCVSFVASHYVHLSNRCATFTPGERVPFNHAFLLIVTATPPLQFNLVLFHIVNYICSFGAVANFG